MHPRADDDWAWCQRRLREVSRTFSEPIRMLPEHLEVALTLGYLLCRVVDTVEDDPDLKEAERQALFEEISGALRDYRSADAVAGRFESHPRASPELELARGFSRLMRVLSLQPSPVRAATARWVDEMIRGMAAYVGRVSAPGTTVQLESLEDLERYCYFVAGTVGQLVTDLFVMDLKPQERRVVEPRLRARCEPFGIGLQMVNILKDVTDDLARGRCFIPRDLLRRAGLQAQDLVRGPVRPAVHQALSPLFRRAAVHLDHALEYTLALPPVWSQQRLFCLLPLWMAVRTLVLAQGNDAMLVPGRPVKISRAEVTDLIENCTRHCHDDAALRRIYRSLWSASNQPIGSSVAAGSAS